MLFALLTAIMARRRSYLSYETRYRLRQVGLFALTVLLSGAVSAAILKYGPRSYRYAKRQLSSIHPTRPDPKVVYSEPVANTRVVPAVDQYRRYMDQAMPLLRSDESVHMIRLEAPANALNFQRNGKQTPRDSGYALRARKGTFPALAVSRNAIPFLEAMRITFVDLRNQEELTEKMESPLAAERLRDRYVLVPDVNETTLGQFDFEKIAKR